MRKQLQLILPVLAGAALVACDIPGDGKADIRGQIIIPGDLVSDFVVQPGSPDADIDCEAATPWGETPAIGDISPTVYIGLYPSPLDPREGGLANGDDRWDDGCGEFDHDDDPTTEPITETVSCPVGGTTGLYAGTIDTAGSVVFEYEALYVDRGQDVYLVAWLDNLCRDDNQATSNLVWDMFGPPSPNDEDGEDIATNQFDIVSSAGAFGPIRVKGEKIEIDPITLDTALSAVIF